MSDDVHESSGRPDLPAADRSRPPAPPGLLAWLPWIAATGFALLAGLLWQAYLVEKGEAVSLREQAALAAIDARSMRQQIEAERILATRRLADQTTAAKTPDSSAKSAAILLLAPPVGSPGPVGIVLWNSREQPGTLILRQLPALPADKSYHLWIIDSRSPAPVDGGTVAVSASGAAQVPFSAGDLTSASCRIVVTVETLGAGQPMTGPIVLSSQ